MVKKELIQVGRKILGIKPPKERRYAFSEDTKKAVLRVQRYRCAVYGCKFRNWRLLEFDHIRGRSNNSIMNCQALCPTHHRLKTKRDAIKMRIEKAKQKTKNR
ncbi:MAG TPA: HNH endonuclease signature motif containing protein [Candidatus Nitrosotenuis sp.]|nr:HNH endonuclease signature motif containing protein [Candidatus Nitrosotenuis sp.]